MLLLFIPLRGCGAYWGQIQFYSWAKARLTYLTYIYRLMLVNIYQAVLVPEPNKTATVSHTRLATGGLSGSVI